MNEVDLTSSIGRVGECSIGRPGLITGRKQMPWGLAWVGIGLDGMGAWSSRNPRIMTAEEIAGLKGYDRPVVKLVGEVLAKAS